MPALGWIRFSDLANAGASAPAFINVVQPTNSFRITQLEVSVTPGDLTCSYDVDGTATLTRYWRDGRWRGVTDWLTLNGFNGKGWIDSSDGDIAFYETIDACYGYTTYSLSYHGAYASISFQYIGNCPECTFGGGPTGGVTCSTSFNYQSSQDAVTMSNCTGRTVTASVTGTALCQYFQPPLSPFLGSGTWQTLANYSTSRSYSVPRGALNWRAAASDFGNCAAALRNAGILTGSRMIYSSPPFVTWR